MDRSCLWVVLNSPPWSLQSVSAGVVGQAAWQKYCGGWGVGGAAMDWAQTRNDREISLRCCSGGIDLPSYLPIAIHLPICPLPHPPAYLFSSLPTNLPTFLPAVIPIFQFFCAKFLLLYASLSNTGRGFFFKSASQVLDQIVVTKGYWTRTLLMLNWPETFQGVWERSKLRKLTLRRSHRSQFHRWAKVLLLPHRMVKINRASLRIIYPWIASGI